MPRQRGVSLLYYTPGLTELNLLLVLVLCVHLCQCAHYVVLLYHCYILDLFYFTTLLYSDICFNNPDIRCQAPNSACPSHLIQLTETIMLQRITFLFKHTNNYSRPPFQMLHWIYSKWVGIYAQYFQLSWVVTLTEEHTRSYIVFITLVY